MSKKLKNICGDRVRKARIARGKQQVELSVEMDIARTSYADLENGKRPILDRELKFLSEYLSVDVRWLLGMKGADVPEFSSQEQNRKRVRRNY